VSLFITELAFDAVSIIDEAKVGILVASILAAAIGALILRAGPGARSDEVVTAAREDG
jgi:Na+/H+ antiporter NhaA